MQHLKPVGQSGGDSFMLAAPRGSGVAPGMKDKSAKGKGKARAEELFADLPEVLASDKEITLQQAYAREEGIPTELQGLQPDMDPHLRQVLEALEDEAFEDAEGDEGWFGELVGGGEVEDGEEPAEFEFEEWGAEEGDGEEEGEGVGEEVAPQDLAEDASWEDRFKAFKQQQTEGGGAGSEVGVEDRSEMADTVGSMASMADMIVKGGKKRRGKRGPSDATGMSMSSSSMFRNKGLTELDNRFDQVRGSLFAWFGL
jgi:protein LTV1